MSASVSFTLESHDVPEKLPSSQEAVNGGERSELVTSRWMTSTQDFFVEQPPHHIHAPGLCPSLAVEDQSPEHRHRSSKSSRKTYIGQDHPQHDPDPLLQGGGFFRNSLSVL